MTEFKKLKDILINQLRPDLATLFENASPSATDAASPMFHELEATHSLLRKTIAIAADSTVRYSKLAAKARETNPDKQIFNEKTAKQIEEAFQEFLQFLADLYEVGSAAVADSDAHADDADTPRSSNRQPQADVVSPASIIEMRIEKMHTSDEGLSAEAIIKSQERGGEWDLGPRMKSLELRFAQAVVDKAALAVAQQDLLDSLQSAEAAERDRRQIIAMTEKTVFQTEMIPAASLSKQAARAAMQARERATYEAEIQRRVAETHSLRERCAEPNAMSDALVAIKAILSPSAHKAFRRSLLDLVDEVINRPENDNVRTLRTDHHRSVAAFGHPAINECKPLYRHVETVLGCVGYTIAYTKQPAHSAKTPRHIAEVNGALELPFLQGTAVPFTYSNLGYEEYGERFLIFQEPDPSEDPQMWCDWHERVSETMASLKKYLLQ